MCPANRFGISDGKSDPESGERAHTQGRPTSDAGRPASDTQDRPTSGRPASDTQGRSMGQGRGGDVTHLVMSPMGTIVGTAHALGQERDEGCVEGAKEQLKTDFLPRPHGGCCAVDPNPKHHTLHPIL